MGHMEIRTPHNWFVRFGTLTPVTVVAVDKTDAVDAAERWIEQHCTTGGPGDGPTLTHDEWDQYFDGEIYVTQYNE